MTDKESSTPTGAGGKAATGANHADLAELLAAVMRHPDTPGEIVNDLADALCGLRDRDNFTDAEVIRRALRNAGAGAAPAAEASGGARGGAGEWPNTLAPSLTDADVEEAARDLARLLGGQNEEAAGLVLALLAAAAFMERNGRAAEGVYTSAQSALMPYLSGPVGAADRFVCGYVRRYAGEMRVAPAVEG